MNKTLNGAGDSFPQHFPAMEGPKEGTTERVPTLTAIDRCNSSKCGAQAYVKVVFGEDSDLYFCAHHFAVLQPNIESAGPSTVLDERWSLYPHGRVPWETARESVPA